MVDPSLRSGAESSSAGTASRPFRIFSHSVFVPGRLKSGMPWTFRQTCWNITLAGILVGQQTWGADEPYTLGPDSQFNPDIPHGVVLQQAFNAGTNSVYPGTQRDYWLYVPKQYDGTKPACLMVFQDGGGYIGTNGSWRVPWVFDNLIAKGEMPVTIGVFVNPGQVPSLGPAATQPRYNRSLEYDAMSDTYADFLIEELLPDVQSHYLINPDPDSHAIAGASSGAIAAFTVAWHRPDAFRRVFSAIGTFVGLRGGNEYPTLIRQTEAKPLRVFLQDGYRDQNIYGGNWWIANQDMLSALQFSGYEVTNRWGTGGHDGQHGGAILPDALRWLWADYPARKIVAAAGSQAPAAALIAGGWQLLGQGYAFPGGLCANQAGEVYFSDRDGKRVYRIDHLGNVASIRADSGGAQGLVVLADGTLLASQPDGARLVALEGANSERFIATDVDAKELTVDHNGLVYFTDPRAHAIRVMDRQGKIRLLDTGIEFPSSLCLSPDHAWLYASDMVGQYVWSFRIGADGALDNKQRYFHLHLPDDPRGSGADGMAVDTEGRLYVATSLGIQVCDPAGRVNVILNPPEAHAWLSDVCFGGKDFDELYLTAGHRVWRRKLHAKGLPAFAAPVNPPPVHL